jgi:hypothetical protein
MIIIGIKSIEGKEVNFNLNLEVQAEQKHHDVIIIYAHTDKFPK